MFCFSSLLCFSNFVMLFCGIVIFLKFKFFDVLLGFGLMVWFFGGGNEEYGLILIWFGLFCIFCCCFFSWWYLVCLFLN